MRPTIARPKPKRQSGSSSSRLTPQTLRHVGLIAGCGALFRILYQVGFKPFWSGDSYVYSNMFFLWTRHFYSTSYRPPLYALFLGLVQELTGTPLLPSRMGAASLYSVVYLQCVLGLTVALLVYASLRVLEIRPRIALAGGLAFSLIGGVCMAELLILTELLSLFFIALASLMFLIAMRALQARASFRWPALASGFAFSLAILTRPENLSSSQFWSCSWFSFVYALDFSAICAGPPGRSLASLFCCLSAAPLVLLWMTFHADQHRRIPPCDRDGRHTNGSCLQSLRPARTRRSCRQRNTAEELSYTNRGGETYRHHVWFAMPELEEAANAGMLPIEVHEHFRESTLLNIRHWLNRNFGFQEHIVANGHMIFQPVDLYDYLGVLSSKLERRYPAAYLQT